MATKHRSAVGGFTLSFGLIQESGDLVGPAVTNAGKSEKFVMTCSECGEPHKVTQSYGCTEDEAHGPFSQGDCSRAKEMEDGSLVAVTGTQLAAAKESELPEKRLELQVHRRAEVEGILVPSGSSYVFRPQPGGKFHGVLLDFLSIDEEFVLMGVANIRKADHLLRLEIGMNGQLMLQELMWPEDVRDFDRPDYEPDEKLLGMASTLIASSVKDYDPEEYKKESRKRVASLVDMVAAGQVPDPAPKRNVKDAADDLFKQMEAAIAAAAR